VKRLLPVGLFVALYMSTAIAVALRYWNYEFVYYGLVMLALVGVVIAVDRRVRFPMWVMWSFAIWGLLHMVGGTLPIPESVTEPGTPRVLYNLRLHPNLPKYDQCVHAFGFFVSTLAAWRAVIVASNFSLQPTIGPLAAAALIGMGLGAMNEVIEFIATLVMPGTNVGGYVNTGWDLVSNMVGCITAAFVIRSTDHGTSRWRADATAR